MGAGRYARRPALRAGLPPTAVALVALVAVASCVPGEAGPPGEVAGNARPTPGDAAPAAGGPGASSPSSSPPDGSSTGAPPAASATPTLLSATGLPGRGWQPAEASTFPPADRWPWALRRCPFIQADHHPAQRHRRQVVREAYERARGGFVAVIVERFAAGWAATSVTELRAVAKTCSRYAAADFMESHTVLREGFAGDESLLIESVRIAPPRAAVVHQWAVIRRGDTVVTLVGAGMSADAVATSAASVAERW